MTDADGHPVHCADALRLRDDMIEMLGALPPIAPALDAIITRFGADAVAEVTGRTRRLLTLPDGSQKLQSRSAAAGVADANLFMAGSKRILVFSDAGGPGDPTTRAWRRPTSSAVSISCSSRDGAPTRRSRALAAPIAPTRPRRRSSVRSPPIAGANAASSRRSPAGSTRSAP
jgi:hypothetical protein